LNGVVQSGKGFVARTLCRKDRPSTVLRCAVKRSAVLTGRERSGKVEYSKGFTVPKRRQPREIWQQTRLTVLQRDGFMCVHCHISVAVETAHIDHIRSGKLAGNELSNLRTLCRRCHVLRSDFRHRGMIAAALRDGIIPPNWRKLVWDG